MAAETTNGMQYQLFIEALTKEKKDYKDAELIYENIRELQFLKNLLSSLQYSEENAESAIDLCYNMKYEKHPMGTFVFKEKDQSNGKFYVILSGEVGVIIRANLSNIYETDRTMIQLSRRNTKLSESNTVSPRNFPGSIQPQNFSTEARKLSNRLSLNVLSDVSVMTNKFLAARKSTKQITDKVQNKEKGGGGGGGGGDNDIENDFNLMVKRYGELRHILKTGNSFGDAALKEPGTPRSASILCKTDCEFLIIDEQTYTQFIKKSQDKRTEFLWNCFSFLPNVSSQQVKNLIFYSFKNKTFVHGEMLTMEGQKPTQPIIYVLEAGECKVERKFVTSLYHPFNKGEIVQQKVGWVTLCNIGPGTIIGEEILLQENGEEVYEYRVTVTSKKSSMLWIEKNTLLGIHPALEEQLQHLYEFKKEKRDQLYEEITREHRDTISKFTEHDKKPFIKENADIAKLLNHSALNILSKKTVHGKSKSQPVASPQLKFQKPVEPKITVKETTQDSPRKKAESPMKRNSFSKPLIIAQEIECPNPSNPLLSKTLLSPTKSEHSNSFSQIPTSTPEIQRQINFDPPTTGKSPKKNLRLQVETMKTDPSIISPRSPKEVLSSTSTGKPFTTERAQKDKEESIYKFGIKEKGYKTIRHKDTSRRFSETIRESAQSLAQTAFINHYKLENEGPTNELGLLKFELTANDKDRVFEVKRLKKLGKGAFSAKNGPNYLHKSRDWSEYLSISPLLSPGNTETSTMKGKDLPSARDSYIIRDRNMSSPNVLMPFALKSARQNPVQRKDSWCASPTIISYPTDDPAGLRATMKDSGDNLSYPLSPKLSVCSTNAAFLGHSKPEYSAKTMNQTLVLSYSNHLPEIQAEEVSDWRSEPSQEASRAG